MVRRSPKALRFAAEATRSYFADGSGTRQDVATWQAWHAGAADAASSLPAAGPGGYVDIPKAVAEIFLAAVEDSIAEMQRRSDRDGDADGDLALLSVIENTLVAELRPSLALRG